MVISRPRRFTALETSVCTFQDRAPANTTAGTSVGSRTKHDGAAKIRGAADVRRTSTCPNASRRLRRLARAGVALTPDKWDSAMKVSTHFLKTAHEISCRADMTCSRRSPELIHHLPSPATGVRRSRYAH